VHLSLRLYGLDSAGRDGCLVGSAGRVYLCVHVLVGRAEKVFGVRCRMAIEPRPAEVSVVMLVTRQSRRVRSESGRELAGPDWEWTYGNQMCA
jgi:hypothetical protein